MSIYEDSISLSGNGERAFATALQTLLPLGFQVESQGSWHLMIINKGVRSTLQHPLQGISRAEFNIGHATLTVKAELDRADWMQKSMTAIFIGAGIFDATILAAMWYFLAPLHQQTWFLAIPVTIFSVWILSSAYMVRLIKERTISS
jgi:hypothetical protein